MMMELVKLVQKHLLAFVSLLFTILDYINFAFMHHIVSEDLTHKIYHIAFDLDLIVMCTIAANDFKSI